jgi:internalin A
MSYSSDSLPAAAETKTEPRRRRRLQFSLRTLLIFVTLVAVVCSCLRIFVFGQYFIAQRAEALGALVVYDCDENPPYRGDVYKFLFGHVVHVVFDKPVSDSDLYQLRNLPRLHYVFVRGPQITDDGLKILAELPNIEALGFEETSITPKGFEELKKIGKLDYVALGGAAVGDSTLEVIGSLPNLRFLKLWETSVTDDGMACVAHLSNLRELYLRDNNNVTDVSPIGQLANIEWLAVESSAALKGFDTWKNLKKLKRLELARTSFGDTNMAFLDDLEELTYLDLERTQITGSGLIHLRSLQNLTTLNLKDTKLNQGIEYLSGLQSLKQLNLEGTRISDSDMIHLQPLTNLEELNLDGTVISDSGIVYLQSLENLESVSLRGTIITGAGLMSLKHLGKLVWLFADVKLNKSDLSELQDSLPECNIGIPDGSAQAAEPVDDN